MGKNECEHVCKLLSYKAFKSDIERLYKAFLIPYWDLYCNAQTQITNSLMLKLKTYTGEDETYTVTHKPYHSSLSVI